jgi:integrase/recombinase XerD
MERAIYVREKKDGIWQPYRNITKPGTRNSHFRGPFFINILVPDSNGGKKAKWQKLEGADSIDLAQKMAEKYDAAQTAAEKGVAVSEPFDEAANGRKSLRVAIEDFLEAKKRKAPATVENYTFTLNQFLEYMLELGIRYVEQINRKVMDAYISWLEKTHQAAPKTLHNKAMVVTFMLKDAGVPNPHKFIKDLLPEIEEEPAEPYTEADLKKLFSVMNNEECVRYTFFLVTACREQEVAHARWEDIVKDSKNIPHYRVRAKEFVGSKGQKKKFPPKNHEQRMIPITEELVKMLAKRKQDSKSEWIFTNEDGYPEGHFLRKFKRIAFRAGLNCGKCVTTRSEGRYTKKDVQKICSTFAEGCEKHYLHRLRKTRATFWHEHDVPLRTIQVYLGHKSLETTMKYLGIQDAAAVQDKINKPMF